jgi:hypothetical protein
MFFTIPVIVGGVALFLLLALPKLLPNLVIEIGEKFISWSRSIRWKLYQFEMSGMTPEEREQYQKDNPFEII